MDKFSIFGDKYGKRKSWHLFGTFLVSLSFVFIYTPAPGHSPGENAWSMIHLVGTIQSDIFTVVVGTVLYSIYNGISNCMGKYSNISFVSYSVFNLQRFCSSST